MKKAVFFDAGHTLINVFEKKRFELFEYFCKKCSNQDLSQVDWQKTAIFAEIHYQNAHKDSQYIITKDFWIEHYTLGLREGGLSFIQAYRIAEQVLQKRSKIPKKFWLEDECMQTLKALKRLGLKIAVVSNWDGTLEDVLTDLSVSSFFDYIADSHIIGSEKPDDKIFLRTLDKMNLNPEEVIHIGDLYYTDILGAKSVGIDSILYDPFRVLTEVFLCKKISSLYDVLKALE